MEHQREELCTLIKKLKIETYRKQKLLERTSIKHFERIFEGKFEKRT